MAPNEIWESAQAHHRQVTPSAAEVELSFLETIAEIEGCDIEDLPRLWPAIGDILQHGFTTPPPQSANLLLEFTYAGYRIRLEQTGAATLVKLPTPEDE